MAGQQFQQMAVNIRNSSLPQRKGCQKYVLKLYKQVELVSADVDDFNCRQTRLNIRHKSNLKKLSEPKYQKIILEKQLNPEFKKIQPNSKISTLFHNCSAISQSDFTYLNPSSFLQMAQSQVMTQTRLRTESQKKLSQKLDILEKSWSRIQSFRELNEISPAAYTYQVSKKTKGILDRVEKRRPQTCTGWTKWRKSN